MFFFLLTTWGNEADGGLAVEIGRYFQLQRGAFLEIQGEGELDVWRVEEDSFTVSAVSLALEVDLRRLKLNRALREKGILIYC